MPAKRSKKKSTLKKAKSSNTRKTKKDIKKKSTKSIKKKGTKKSFTKKELKIYREKLLNLRDEVLTQIEDLSQDTLMKSQKDISGDISGYSIHMADVASDHYEREFNLGLVSNERKIIMEIEEALKRIEENKYGICLMCQKPINKKRLEAIPYARYCRQCQEKIEKEERI